MRCGLKRLKEESKTPDLAILRRPQFIGKNIHRGRYLKPVEIDENRILLTPPPIDVDATRDVLAAFSSPFGIFTGMGAWPTLARVSERMTMALLKAIREKAEEMKESKENL